MSNEIINTANNDKMVCTISVSSVKDKLIIANAINAADSLNNHINEWFTLVDIIQKPGFRSINNTACTDTYLITSNGEIFFSQSDGVKDSAYIYASIFDNDFGDGIVVKCIEQKLSGGRAIKKLVAQIG